MQFHLWGLVFDNEIAAQQQMRMRIRPDVHLTQFWKWKKGLRQPTISGSKGLSRVGPIRCGNQIGVRRAKEAGEQRDWESKGGQKSQGAMGNKEDGGSSLFFHQIIDFSTAYLALAPTLHSLYFSRTYPPTLSYCCIR